MPYEWGHPQFDTENAMEWGEFIAENPYVENQGRLWFVPKVEDRDE